MNKSLCEKLSLKAATRKLQAGKIGYILLWLLGIPIPVLVVGYSHPRAVRDLFTARLHLKTVS